MHGKTAIPQPERGGQRHVHRMTGLQPVHLIPHCELSGVLLGQRMQPNPGGCRFDHSVDRVERMPEIQDRQRLHLRDRREGSGIPPDRNRTRDGKRRAVIQMQLKQKSAAARSIRPLDWLSLPGCARNQPKRIQSAPAVQCHAAAQCQERPGRQTGGGGGCAKPECRVPRT